MKTLDVYDGRYLNYEYAKDPESGKSLLLLRTGDKIFIGYDVPEPRDYVPEQTKQLMQPHEIEAGYTWGWQYAMEKLRRYVIIEGTEARHFIELGKENESYVRHDLFNQRGIIEKARKRAE